MRSLLTPALLVVSAVGVSGCGGDQPPAASLAATYQPVISLNEIMVNIVDPHSHEIWDADWRRRARRRRPMRTGETSGMPRSRSQPAAT